MWEDHLTGNRHEKNERLKASVCQDLFYFELCGTIVRLSQSERVRYLILLMATAAV